MAAAVPNLAMVVTQEYNHGLLKDAGVRNRFIQAFQQVLDAGHVRFISVPDELYRGVRLYPPSGKMRSILFFTSSLDEAMKYRKLSPFQVLKFSPPAGAQVLDLTHARTLQELTDCFCCADMPQQVAKAFVESSAALDVAANTSFEDDLFGLMQDALSARNVIGLFRRTKSSTLNRNAAEFAIYKQFVPSKLPQLAFEGLEDTI